MADYDSDSSGADDIETGVTLGYASKEATGDDFSQIGGHPVWKLEKPKQNKTTTNKTMTHSHGLTPTPPHRDL